MKNKSFERDALKSGVFKSDFFKSNANANVSRRTLLQVGAGLFGSAMLPGIQP